jgi:hypothetical protein
MKISSLLVVNPSTGPKSPAEVLIEQKHSEYASAAKTYRAVYYATRLTAGLSAGLLPFVVSAHPQYALALSIAIVVCTVIDLVFGVRDKWQLMSRAADLLTIQRLKISGEYDKYKDVLEILVNTESAKLAHLVDLDTLLKKAKDASGEK